MKWVNRGFLLAVTILLQCFASVSISHAAEVSLTVLVSGVKPDSREPVPVRKATVVVVDSSESVERITNAKGQAKFMIPAGKVSIIVTGQDTTDHWATGICSAVLETDLIARIQLDLEAVTRECTQEPLVPASVAEQDDQADASADEEPAETADGDRNADSDSHTGTADD